MIATVAEFMIATVAESYLPTQYRHKNYTWCWPIKFLFRWLQAFLGKMARISVLKESVKLWNLVVTCAE